MVKKYFLPIILVTLLSSIGIFTYFQIQEPSQALPSEFKKTPIKKPMIVKGILRSVGADGEEIGMANNLYGNNAQFQIIRSGEQPFSWDQKVIGHFSSSSAIATYDTLTLADSGKCVEVEVSSYAEPPPVADNYHNLPILTVDKLTVMESLSCYDENPNLYPSTYPLLDQPIAEITAVVFSASRPAHDIGYDYEIRIPWSEAKSKGYMDYGAYEYTPTDIVSLFITANNLDTAKKIELAKRSGNPVTLTGQFVWGYAEMNIFQVTAVATDTDL